MEGKDYLTDVGVDGRVILNCSLINKECAPAYSGDLVGTNAKTSGCIRSEEFSLLVERLSACQKGPSRIQLVMTDDLVVRPRTKKLPV